MRFFEVILLIISTVFPFLLSFKFFRSNKITCITLISAVLIFHLIFVGYRWQLIPAYIMILLINIFLYKELKFLKRGWFSMTVRLFFMTIFLVIGWSLPIIFPVFTLPAPTGEYQIGSQKLKITTDYPEIITKDPDDKREFMVKVWYPATVKNEKTEPYLDQGNRLGFSNKYGLPEFFTNYLDYIETHTYKNPDIAEGKFPILIFSHGYYSEAFGYYAIIEEIVSHGFIVFNINHTYESTGSLFPNGDIKLYNKAFDQKTNNLEMREMTWNTMQNYKKATSEYEQFRIAEDLIRNYVAADATKRWSKDISIVINNLGKWNETTFLSNHLNLSKIGAFGHSQGGAAVGQALIEDNRIDAGINLDGMQWGSMIDTTLHEPFMLISSNWDQDHPNLNKHAYRNLSDSTFYNLIIENTGHSNFMDIPLLINLPYINEVGTIDPYKGYEVTTSLILAFFNKKLKNQETSIKDLAETFEKIEIIN